MLIVKGTTDVLISEAIRIVGVNNAAVLKVKEFNTSTLTVVKEDDSTQTAVDYMYYVGEDEVDATIAVLPIEEQSRILPGESRGWSGTQSMKYDVDDADYVFQILGFPRAFLVKCSNCSTSFILFGGDNAEDCWAIKKVNETDKHFTATQVTAGTIVCDNCDAKVVLQ